MEVKRDRDIRLAALVVSALVESFGPAAVVAMVEVVIAGQAQARAQAGKVGPVLDYLAHSAALLHQASEAMAAAQVDARTAQAAQAPGTGTVQ